MNRFLFFGCILAAPLFSDGGYYVGPKCYELDFEIIEKATQYTKREMIEKAESHRELALEQLRIADSICLYIPDLSKREHMYALISATITSANVSDPKTKLITIGLHIISSVAIDAYDKMLDLKSAIIKAGYHLEMQNFYNACSLEVDCEEGIDDASRLFFEALDHLTMAEMLSELMWNKYSKEKLLYIISDFRKQILARAAGEFNRCAEDLFYTHAALDKLVGHNEWAVDKQIFHCIYEAAMCLQAAEKIKANQSCWWMKKSTCNIQRILLAQKYYSCKENHAINDN